LATTKAFELAQLSALTDVTTSDTTLSDELVISAGSLTLDGGRNVQWGGGFADGFPSVWGHSANKQIRFAPDGTTSGILYQMTATQLEVNPTTTSTTSTSGALVVAGGAGIAENLNVGGNIVVSGDLTVEGTSVTLNTTDLNVVDKNITLNYHATADTSASAGGAGITIQDAVDASTDASILWNATNSAFDFSHEITAPSALTLTSNAPRIFLYEADTTDLNTALFSSGGKFTIRTTTDDDATRTTRLEVDHSTGDIGFYEDNSGTPQVGMHWDYTDGRLGIGTDSPQAPLDIDGAYMLIGDGTFEGALGRGNSLITGQTASDFVVSASNSNDLVLSTGGADRLHILSTGEVGIGTDDPDTNLEISSLYGTTLRLSSIRNSNAWTPGQSIGQIQMYSADGTAPTASVRASIDAVVDNAAGNEVGLVFRTYNNTERLRIDHQGHVGIGTDAPNPNGTKRTLHISNTASGAAIRLAQSDNALIRYDDTSGLQIGTLATKDVILETADVTAVTISGDTQNVNFVHIPSTDEVRHNIRPSFIADFANSKELDSRFKFYRTTGSVSTYYDKNGIIRYAVEDEPRFDHDPVTKESKGLLIEEAHTNLLEDASRGTFGWSHDAVLTKDNAAEAPDGTFDAFLVQPTTSDGKISAGGITSGAGTYTGSVWLKSATTDGSNVSMDIALYDVNSFYTNNITVTSEWQRFEVTYNSTNASTQYPRFYVGGASSMAKGEDVYVWGAQLETGGFASSYIPAVEQFQSRAGTTGAGTYYDYEGKLTTATGSQERYGYKHNGRRWIPTGLIRESEAANLWNHSEDTYSYNWVKSAVSVSKRGTILGPDGQYSAQRITAGAGSSYHYMYRSAASVLTSGKWYTVSFFVKSGTENRIATYHSNGSETKQLIFNMDTKSFEYQNLDYYGYEEAYDGWMRIWYTFQATANVSPNMHFFMRSTGQYTTSGGEYFDFFGFQLEEELNNNQNAGPTSYIKTEASSVTRGADSVDCEYSSHGADHVYMTDLDWYNEEAGTFYYEASSNHPSTDTGGGRLGFSYDEDNAHRIMANINSTSYALFIQSDGTTYLNMNNTAPLSVGAVHKRAWAATTGDATAYINGTQIGTGANIVMPKINTFKLSNPTTDGDYSDGHYKKIAYYPERLSNAMLAALTEND